MTDSNTTPEPPKPTNSPRPKPCLTTNVSHELRTPVRSIADYSQLLADGEYGALTEEQVETVHIIRETANDLLKFINNLSEPADSKNDRANYVLQAHSQNGHKHIFIADDDNGFREVLKCALGGEGYHVAEATNGREVIDNLQRVQPDLLLLDLKMPDVDGWEVIRYLAAHPQLNHHHVIVITGDTLDEDENIALRKHTDGVIRKGEFKVQTVLDKVAAVLETASNAQAPTDRR